MPITNITRVNTIDEWRIQTNQSANAINNIEVGNFNKTNGTLFITSNGALSITAEGTAFSVANAALFSTDVTIGKNLVLGASVSETGNLTVGANALFYGKGTGLFVANNATINNNLQVTQTIRTNNITANSNVTILNSLDVSKTVKTANLVVIDDALVSKNLSVSGNVLVSSGIQTTSNTTGALRVDGGVGVTGNIFVSHLNAINSLVADTARIASNTTGAHFIASGSLVADTARIASNTTGAHFIASGSLVADTARIASNTTGSHFIASGSLVADTARITSNTTGAHFIASNSLVGGTIRSTETTESTSNSTGSMVTPGGLGVSKSAFISGNLTVKGDAAGAVNTSVLVSIGDRTSNSAGNVFVYAANTLNGGANGSLTVQGNSTVTGNLNLGSDERTTSVTSGALRVSGGVGVTGNVWSSNLVSTGAIYGTTGVHDSGIRVVRSVTPSSPIVSSISDGSLSVSHATSGVTAATHGSSIQVPVFVVNDTGHVSAVTNTTIRSATTSLTGVVQLDTTEGSTSETTVVVSNVVTTANTKMKSYVDVANTRMQSYVDVANTNMKNYVDVANTNLKSYVDVANTNMKNYVDTANTNMKSYVDVANTNMKNYVDTANTNMKSYVDVANTNMKSYVDVANTNMKSYVDVANTRMQSYVDVANTRMQSYVDVANTGLKSYTDASFVKLTSPTQTITGSLTVSSDLAVQGKLSVAGDFVLTGDILYDTDALTISTTTPVTTTGAAYFGVFRGNDKGGVNGGSGGTNSNANAYIRWTASSNTWQIRDVFNNDLSTSYTNILTTNSISSSLTSTSQTVALSSAGAKTLSESIVTANTNMKNYVDTANTNMKSYVDVANTNMKSYVDVANTNMKNYVDTANTNMKNYVDGNFLKVSGTGTTQTISSDVSVTGNLTVTGTYTTVNTEEINLADNEILLNSNLAQNQAPSQDSGILINRGTLTNVYIRWNETIDSWVANNGLSANEFRLANTTKYLTEDTNLYFTTQRSRESVSASAPLNYNSSTGEFTHATAGTAGTHGSASKVPVFVTNATGHITGVTNTDIAISYTAVSGLAGSATTDTRNADNISSGTLSVDRLATSGATAGSYGNAATIPRIIVDAKGRITDVVNVAVSIPSGSVTGLAGSATTDTRNADNINSGTLAFARLSDSGAAAGSYGNAATIPRIIVDAKGRITDVVNVAVSIPSGSVTGLAGSATTDTRNADNISSGTLSADRLASVSAGVSGVYGGNATSVAVTVDTKGRVTAIENKSIVIPSSSVTGLATSATTDTTNANFISSGTLNTARMADSGAVAGSYGGNGTNYPRIVVDAKGRITSVTNTTISFPAEADTLQTVTTRGATTDRAVQFTNGTASTSSATGAVRINTGGLGVGGNTFVAGLINSGATAPPVTSSTGIFDNGNRVASSNTLPIQLNRTTGNISHAASGVTAGTYGTARKVPQIAVNDTGHITSITALDITTATITAGTYGSASQVPVVQVDNQGFITSITNQSISSSNQDLNTTNDVQFKSLGIGVTASGVTGQIRATADIISVFSSDRKLKENIKDISSPLEKVSAIGGKTFDWKDEYIEENGGEDGYFINKSDFGVIAQDVQQVFPLAVKEREDGTLAVDYVKLVALAFAAIKELKNEIDELKKKE